MTFWNLIFLFPILSNSTLLSSLVFLSHLSVFFSLCVLRHFFFRRSMYLLFTWTWYYSCHQLRQCCRLPSLSWIFLTVTFSWELKSFFFPGAHACSLFSIAFHISVFIKSSRLSSSVLFFFNLPAIRVCHFLLRNFPLLRNVCLLSSFLILYLIRFTFMSSPFALPFLYSLKKKVIFSFFFLSSFSQYLSSLSLFSFLFPFSVLFGVLFTWIFHFLDSHCL